MTPVELSRQLKSRSFFLPCSLAIDIAEALYELGGSAHRSTVIDWVARRKGEIGSAMLEAKLIEAFAQASAPPADGKEPLLHLPMGPGSHRWGLTAAGYGALRGLLLPKVPTLPAPAARIMPPAVADRL